MNNQQTTIGMTSVPETPVVHNARLTASEIAQLWASFMQYTMLTCIFSYFERTVQDTSIKELMTENLSRFQTRTSFITDAFQKENFPLPMGFTEQDVNLEAPPLGCLCSPLSEKHDKGWDDFKQSEFKYGYTSRYKGILH
ncbi:MAG: DUF3231 family protein [Syntrophomonas sp.]